MDGSEVCAVKSFPARGCSVDYGSRVPGPYGHVFCGAPSIRGAACPSCKRPLVQLLSLDTSDPLLEATDSALGCLPLLFCWGCTGKGVIRFYGIEGSLVMPLWRARRDQAVERPYADYPAAFPSTPARLVPLPNEVQAHLRHLNHDLCVASGSEEARQPRHQVGGEPLLLAPWRVVACPRCRRRMPFCAAIADENLDPRGFSGCAQAQVLFHLCRGCGTVGAYSQSR
jgi:hypothetical protein